MEASPIVIDDEYVNKQEDKYLVPLRAGSDVAFKTFKYNTNGNDKERLKVSVTVVDVMLAPSRGQLSH